MHKEKSKSISPKKRDGLPVDLEYKRVPTFLYHYIWYLPVGSKDDFFPFSPLHNECFTRVVSNVLFVHFLC